MRSLARSLVFALLLAGACGHAALQQSADRVAFLDGNHEPLRARFDADRGHVRLLVLASPS